MRFWKHAVLAAILTGAILLTGCEKIVGKLPPAPPGPPPGGLPTAVLNRGYLFVLKVSATGTPSFVLSGGLLPAGINLAIDGTFSGSPTEIGIFNFVVDITDNNGTTSAGMTLEVAPALAVGTATLPTGFVDVTYSQSLLAVGGIPGYTWVLETPTTDPAGLDITDAGPGNATYSGLPTAPGVFTFDVTVTDTGNVAVLPAFVRITLTIVIMGAPAAYVTNDGDGTVSVIDMSTNTVIDIVTVGNNPQGITLSPNGAVAYVSNFGSDSVSVIDVANIPPSVTATIPVGGGPRGIAATKEGRFVYVSNTLSNSVSIIDMSLATPAVINTLPLSNLFPNAFFAHPEGIATTPDGALVFIAISDAEDVDGAGLTIDVPDEVIVVSNDPTLPNFHSIIGRIQTVEGPREIAYSAAASTLIVAGSDLGEVSLIDIDQAGFSFMERTKVSLGGGMPTAVGVSTACNSVHIALTGSGEVTPVDVNVDVARASFTVASAPRGIAFDPDGTVMYVAQSGTNQVLAITLATGAVQATITVGNGPYAMVAQKDPTLRVKPLLPELMPEGSFDVEYKARVCAAGGTAPFDFTLLDGDLPPGLSIDSTGLVSGTPTDPSLPDFPDLSTFGVEVIDSSNPQLTLTESLNLRLQVCCLGVGRLMYVANSGDNSVSAVNVVGDTLFATITNGIGDNPVAVAASPDLNRIYVTNFLTNSVSVIDSDPLSVGFNTVFATFLVGLEPAGIVLSPDGSRAYVSNEGDGTVSVVDTVTFGVIQTVNVESSPEGMALNGDGSKLYVANHFSNTVSIIDTVTFATSSISVASGPVGVAFDPGSDFVYVTSQFAKLVNIIDTATDSIVGTINVGNFPTGIVMGAGGNRRAYVANQLEDTVSVIDLNINQELPGRISVGSSPDFLTAFGDRVYVSNFGASDLSRIVNNPASMEDNTTKGTVSVGMAPEGLKFPGGN